MQRDAAKQPLRRAPEGEVLAPVPALQQAAPGRADHVLALQVAAGNRAVAGLLGPGTPVLARFRRPRALRPIGLNVAEFIATDAPGLLGVIPRDQIQALQERHDAAAANKEVQKEAQAFIDDYEARYHLPITGDGNAMRELNAIKKRYREVPKGSNELTVDTAQLIGPDFARYDGKNQMLEQRFRQKIRDELVTAPITVILDEHDDRVILRWRDERLFHKKGRLAFEDVIGTTSFGQRYHDEVQNPPEIQELKKALNEITDAISELSVEHRLRSDANRKHPFVRHIAEWLGGPDISDVAKVMIDAREHPEKGSVEQRLEELKAPYPPLAIWKAPEDATMRTWKALNSGEYEAAFIGITAASRLTQQAAERYLRYEEKVMKGAGIAVKWLERVKVAGKIAAGIASGGYGFAAQGAIAAGYSFVQEGSQQLSEVNQGLRQSVDVGGLVKQAGIEGAMAYFGGRLQHGFGEALKVRFATRLTATFKSPAFTEAALETIASGTSAFYTAPMAHAMTKIVNGQVPVPTSLGELADLIADEAITNVKMDIGMRVLLGRGRAPAGDPSVHVPGAGDVRAPNIPDAPKPSGAGEHATADPHTGEQTRTQTDPAPRPGDASGGAVPVGVPTPRAPDAPTPPPAPGGPDPRVQELAARVDKAPHDADALIDHFGSWEDAVAALQKRTGGASGLDPAVAARAVDALVARRRGVVDTLTTEFGATPVDKTASSEPGSDVDLNVSGDDAGLRVAQATGYLDTHHPGWQKRYRMGVMVDAKRTGNLAKAMGSLPEPMQTQLRREQTLATEAYLLAREAAAAPDPQAKARILEQIGDAELRKKAEFMAGLDAEGAKNERTRLLAHSDRAVAAVDPSAAPDVRANQIRDAMDTQMRINALDPDAYLSPGAIRGVVLGESLPPAERYQTVIEQVGMIQHVAGGPEGMRGALRRYETFKYIQRICDQLAAAGVKDARITFLRNHAELVYNVDRSATSSAEGRTVGAADLTSKAREGQAQVAYDDLGPVQGVSDRFLADVHGMLQGMLNDHLPALRQQALGPGAGGKAGGGGDAPPVKLPDLGPERAPPSAAGGAAAPASMTGAPTPDHTLGEREVGLRSPEAMERVAEGVTKAGAPAAGTTLQHYAQTLFTPIATELTRLGIPAPQVVAAPLDPGVRAQYSPANNVVYINENALTAGKKPLYDINDPVGRQELANALVHEARHAEQYVQALRYLFHVSKTRAPLARAKELKMHDALIKAAQDRPLTPDSPEFALAERSYNEFVDRAGEQTTKFGQDTKRIGQLRQGIEEASAARGNAVTQLTSIRWWELHRRAEGKRLRQQMVELQTTMTKLEAELRAREQTYWKLFQEVDARGAEADLKRYLPRAEARAAERRMHEAWDQIDRIREMAPWAEEFALTQSAAAMEAYANALKRVDATARETVAAAGAAKP